MMTAEQHWLLLSLLQRHLPGVAVWGYGSRVKGTARTNSDLDLVAFATPSLAQEVAEFKEACEESTLPFRVELHVWDELPESFHRIIKAQHVVVQEAP